MRLIDKSLPYNPDGKVGNLTKNTFEIYNETNEHKGTQLIFCDIGTPKNNTSQTHLSFFSIWAISLKILTE